MNESDVSFFFSALFLFCDKTLQHKISSFDMIKLRTSLKA